MEKKHRILLVDDDREVLQLNGEYLTKKGFSVSLAENAEDAIRQIQQKEIDCIVLDVMMPGMNGFTAIKLIRDITEAPVLFLTGKMDEDSRIQGLMLGADDYITKPCSLEELALRIQIHIRKSTKANAGDSVLEFPPLRIQLLEHKAFVGEEEIPLSNREYDLLVLFGKNPGREMTFEEIGRQLYGSSLDSDRKNVMVNASRLRKKLEGYVGMESMIETIWGKGYRFKG